MIRRYKVGASVGRILAGTLLLVASTLGMGCDAKDLLDVALDPPSRKPIDASLVGVNNFFVLDEFGSIEDQFLEIRDTLGLKYVRILMAWTDGVQSGPNAPLNYSFYDRIVEAIPPGLDVVVVLAHTPNWITNPANWTENNPRFTYAVEWVRPTVRRYANHPRIVGWEVWNEPDLTVVASDSALEVTNPEKYAELVAYASDEVRRGDPGKLVILGATRSIQQEFPITLQFNKDLKNLGVENFVDVWNVHYYGTRYESVVTQNGVKDFLNSLSVPIWITESGEQGPNKQLAYVETAWPFLKKEIPGIQRFYYYEFASKAPLEQNYGLRTGDPSLPVSDLYVFLRDRPR